MQDGGYLTVAEALGSPQTLPCSHPYRAYRCRVCEVEVPRTAEAWSTHAAGIRHRRLAAARRLPGGSAKAVAVSVFESQPAARATRLPPSQLDQQRAALRAAPELLLDVQHATALGYDGPLVEAAQREAARRGGVTAAEAKELQGSLLAALADRVSVRERLYRLASASLTDLAAGAALAQVGAGLCRASSGRGMINLLEGADIVDLEQPLHLAALAQLGRRAGRTPVGMLTLRQPSTGGRGAAALWIAAASLLLPRLRQLPGPPRELVLVLRDPESAPGTAESLLRALVGVVSSTVFLERVTVAPSSAQQAAEAAEFVESAAWREASRLVLEAVRRTLLLGVLRSRASPLRLLPPSVLPLVLRHLTPCRLHISPPA